MLHKCPIVRKYVPVCHLKTHFVIYFQAMFTISFSPDPDAAFRSMLTDPLPDPDPIQEPEKGILWPKIVNFYNWKYSFFVSGWQAAKKYVFFPSVFAYYFLKVHLHQFKDKKKSQKGEIQVFLNFFAYWWKDPDPESPKIMTDTDPGGQKKINRTPFKQNIYSLLISGSSHCGFGSTTLVKGNYPVLPSLSRVWEKPWRHRRSHKNLISCKK